MAKFLDLEGLNYFWEKIKSWVQGYSASKNELNQKQNTLVSGLNIKTINNENILGSGNISIQNAVNSVNGKIGNVLLTAEDVGALSSYTETDPTVPSWAKLENKPTYDYSEILNTPAIPVVPTNVSAFNNDAGYLTQHLDISGKADKATTLSGYGITDAYTKNDIDAKVSSAYKAAGSVSSVSNLGSLDVSHEGFVYNMSASFTTTSDFVEGSGITYPAGTNVVIVNSNTVQDPIYKYDVLAGFVDLLNYVLKSNTTGLLKNDGTIDTSTYLTQHQDISGKADKVSSSTNGNFAALDSNGNLTDSGSKASDFAASARAIPSGGNAGQILKKVSADPYDVTWANQSETLPSAYCTTAGGTATKKANCSLYVTQANQYLQVLIGSANTYQGALTLNINSAGAKPIYINGTVSSSSNYTLPNGTYFVFYDGTNYYFRTDGKIQGPSGTLYIKPSTGIPASDIASGVIPVQDVTVGGTSVVSNGTAVIPQEVFVATHGVTTFNEVLSAYNAGKICVVVVNSQFVEILSRVQSSSITFTCQIGSYLYRCTLSSNDTWSANSVYENELASNRVSTITGYETNTTKYPNAKAVADALGKWGVISQTQTWSGTGSQPRTYVMSDQVYGTIPQANIDLFESAGATFNATTGYFELNGLTDISYEEMLHIMNTKPTSDSISIINAGSACTGAFRKISNNVRLIPKLENYSTIGLRYLLYNCGSVEVLSIGEMTISSFYCSCYSCLKLSKIDGIIKLATAVDFTSAFEKCYSLKDISLKSLNTSVSFHHSSVLTLASIVYMVENAINTTAITITLHADALARCTADTTEYEYNGNTYTGIVALATAKNITLAS